MSNGDDIVRLGFQIDSSAFDRARTSAAGATREISKLGDQQERLANSSGKAGQGGTKVAAAIQAMMTASNAAQSGIAALSARVGNLATAFGISTGSPSGVALSAALQASTAGVSAMARGLGTFSPLIGAAAGGVGALGTAFIGAQAALATFQDKYAQYEGRLKNALGSQAAAIDSMEKLSVMSKQAGISVQSAIEAFTRLARNGEQLGATRDQLLQLTETIQKLGVISGASQGEVASGMLQLSQALASGRLNGDELRSIMENMPALAKAIADGLGVGVGQIRAMGAAGELTGYKVFQAILSQTDKTRKEFESLPDTTERAFQRMTDQAGKFAAEFGKRMESSEFIQRIIRGFDRMLTMGTEAVKGETAAERLARTTREYQEAAEGYGATSEGMIGYTPQEVKRRRKEMENARAALIQQEAQRQKAEADEAEKIARAPQGRADSTMQELDKLKKQRTEIETQMKTLKEGIDSAGRTGDVGKLKQYTTGLAVLEAQLDDVGTAADKFRQGISDAERALAAGGGGGGSEIMKQVFEMGRSTAKATGEADGALGAAIRERVVRIKEQIVAQNQATAATQKQAETIGMSRDQMREAEIAAEALDLRFQTFGTLTGPEINKVIEQFTRSLRASKLAAEAMSDGMAFQALRDELSVIAAQQNAITAGAFAMREAAAKARADIAERSQPGAGNRDMQRFYAGEGLSADEQINALLRQTDAANRMGAAAADPRARRALELDERVRSAQEAVPDKYRGDIGAAIRGQDAADTTRNLKEQAAQINQQAHFTERQLELSMLSGREYQRQVELLRVANDLERQGIDIKSEGAQAVLQATEARLNAQSALEDAMQVGQAWRDAWAAAGDALTEYVMTGKLEMRDLTDTILREIVRVQIQKGVVEPASNFLSGIVGKGLAAIGGLIFHGGGEVGASSVPSRSLPASLFYGAPRFHDGLYPGEFPAILKRGETVSTPEQMKAMQGSSITVNVPVNIEGGGAKQGDMASLGKQIDAAVRRVISDEMRIGGALNPL
jgi:tape measure domain-containing protein